jgi:hypothetical protein
VSAIVYAAYQAKSLKRDEEKSSQTLRTRGKGRFVRDSDTNLRNSGPLLEVGVQVLVAGLCIRTEGGEYGGGRKGLGKEQETISHLISIFPFSSFPPRAGSRPRVYGGWLAVAQVGEGTGQEEIRSRSAFSRDPCLLAKYTFASRSRRRAGFADEEV